MIEYLGLPGSGKSTLARAALKRLRKRGHHIIGAGRHARESSAEGPRFVKRHEDRSFLFHAVRFRREYPEFVELAQQHFPPDDENFEFLFHVVAACYAAWKFHPIEDGRVFLDEGFGQMAVHNYMNGRQADFEHFLKLAPAPDTLVYVEVPPDIAYQRAVERNPERLEKIERLFGNQQDFEARADRLGLAFAHYRAKGGKVLRIDATQDVATAAKEIVAGLT